MKIGLTKTYVDMWRRLLLRWLSILIFLMVCMSTLFLYSELLSQVEVGLVLLCNGLLDHFTPPVCAACSSAVLDFV